MREWRACVPPAHTASMKQRYSYRAYPTPRQQGDLARLFGACRYIYNCVVEDRKMIFETGLHLVEEPHPTKPGKTRRVFTANRQAALLTYQRSRKPWLRDVSSVALIQSMRDADRAFNNFFASVTGARKGARVGFPKFKSRFNGKQSARFTSNGFGVDGDRLYIAKIGHIRFRLSRDLPSAPSSVTITRNPDQTYEVSFVVDVEPEDLTPKTVRHAGIDLGLESFAAIVYSDGTREKVANPRFYKRQQRKLRRAKRALARKAGPDKRTRQAPSNGYRKQRVKVARLESAVAHARTDFTSKLAYRLASENTTIAIESLSIRGLARAGGRNAQGRGLRRSVHDAAWGAFSRALENAAPGRVTQVDPAYTSQTCSQCGVIDGPKPLHVRQWACPCGVVLDRDYNAAVNVLVAAGHAETLNAGGGSVRLRLSEAAPQEAGTRRSGGEMTE